MFLNWLPWKFIIRRAARAYGILDPVAYLRDHCFFNGGFFTVE